MVSKLTLHVGWEAFTDGTSSSMDYIDNEIK